MTDRPQGSDDRLVVADIALRAVTASPDARAALLEALSIERPDLRAAVDRLLVEYTSTPDATRGGERDLLDDLGSAFRLAIEEEETVPDIDQSGSTIGRYALTRRLGVGAFGAVYAAQQVSPIERVVALKLLHPGVGSPRVVRRFDRERRALARLAHPGIARLFDAGTGPDGRPYLVMELIDGVDLRRHCETTRPTVDTRVRLLAEVCDAIQHAHGHGILHRDLKPANIIVRRVDGRSVPVVIDFGVAGLIDPDGAADMTSIGQPIGTRRYMSPEQRAGDPVDVRGDIFALGVTLLDLFAAEGVSSPSGPVPVELRWIADRCCAQAPADRYQSAAELGTDLRRFLRRMPVSAAPPSPLYQLSKMVVRHPWLSTLSTLAATLIVGMGISSHIAARQLGDQVDVQRAMIIETIDDVLDEVWVFMGSEEARERITQRLLDRTDRLLDRRPDDLQLLHAKARLLRALGYLLQERGDFDALLAVSVEGVQLCDRIAARLVEDPEFGRLHAETVVRVGNALQLAVADDESVPVKAVAQYQRALEMIKEQARRHPDHVGLLDDLFWCHSRLCRYQPDDLRDGFSQAALDLALDLHGRDPTRLLSRFALGEAHLTRAEILLGRDDGAATQHLSSAVNHLRDVTSVEPNRGAFVAAYEIALRLLVAQLRRTGDTGAMAPFVGELHELIHSIPEAHRQRSDMLRARIGGLAELARAWHTLGATERANECYRLLASLESAVEVRQSDRNARSVEGALSSLESIGFGPR